jgi:hypothetical protein
MLFRKASTQKTAHVCIGLCLTLLLGLSLAGPTSAQIRIVIAPFYAEEGMDVDAPEQASRHYRRVIRFIGNPLVRQGYEVINPFAREMSEKEYSRILQRAKEDSPLAAKDLCKKYASDIAYIVWLDVHRKQTVDGYCKATVGLDGEGYDGAGRDLGVSIQKNFIVTRRECRAAVTEAEKELGILVGRKLASGMDNKKELLAKAADKEKELETPRHKDNIIEVRLDGATEYTLSEIFAKVINTAPGVIEAKRMASSIVPNNPQASWVVWRIRIEDTDSVRLQANMLKMINDILDAGGAIHYKGVPYRYTPEEVALFKGIRPGDSTTRKIQFVIDRDLARDKTLQ